MLWRIARPALTARPWLDVTYLTLGLVAGCAALALVLAGPLTGALLLITLIGIPKLYGDLWATRWLANMERRRGALAGVPIPVSRRVWRGDGLMQRLRAALSDPMTWREFAWEVLLFGIGLGFCIAGVTVWATALSILVAPLWMWSIPGGVDWGVINIDNLWEMFGMALVLGPPLVVLAAWIVRGLTLGQAYLARALLLGDEQERIAELRVSRAGAVDAAAAELRRIERDLHDGAQARLVALAMDLGMARERLSSDPQTAAQMLDAAHEDAKTALAELRDLARGIHPAILTDRGLDAAVSALAARCPVPCGVAVQLPDRLPAAVEAAAYFTVAEALTNVAKHSGATRCEIAGAVEAGRLVVEVRDDGRGGVNPAHGTGITGLRGRIEALDGRLLVASAASDGSGTILRAEIPCAS